MMWFPGEGEISCHADTNFEISSDSQHFYCGLGCEEFMSTCEIRDVWCPKIYAHSHPAEIIESVVWRLHVKNSVCVWMLVLILMQSEKSKLRHCGCVLSCTFGIDQQPRGSHIMFSIGKRKQVDYMQELHESLALP